MVPVWNASPPNEENNRGTLSLQEAAQIKCGNSRSPLSGICFTPKGANMWIKKTCIQVGKLLFFFYRMRQWNVNMELTVVQFQPSEVIPLCLSFLFFVEPITLLAETQFYQNCFFPLLLFVMQFRCCGVTNHTDWFEVYNASRVPDSCCLEYSDNCGLDNPGTWWTAVSFHSQLLWSSVRRGNCGPVNCAWVTAWVKHWNLRFSSTNLELAPSIGTCKIIQLKDLKNAYL